MSIVYVKMRFESIDKVSSVSNCPFIKKSWASQYWKSHCDLWHQCDYQLIKKGSVFINVVACMQTPTSFYNKETKEVEEIDLLKSKFVEVITKEEAEELAAEYLTRKSNITPAEGLE